MEGGQLGKPARSEVARLFEESQSEIDRGNTDAAVASYGLMISRFSASTDPDVQSDVNLVLLHRAWYLGDLGRFAESIADSEEVLRRVRGEGASELTAYEFARALRQRSWSFAQLGRIEEAIAGYDELQERFGTSQDSSVLENVAFAVVRKGSLLADARHFSDALAAYREAISRFAYLREAESLVAEARLGTGSIYSELGMRVAAIQELDQLIRDHSESDSVRARHVAAQGVLARAVVLNEVGRHEEAREGFDEAICQLQDSPDMEDQDWAIYALITLGQWFGKAGDNQEAVKTYSRAIGLFAEATAPVVRQRVARARTLRGFALQAEQAYADALADYDAVINDAHSSPSAAGGGPVLDSLVWKAALLNELGRLEEAIGVCDRVEADFGRIDDPSVRPNIDWAINLRDYLREAIAS